LLMTFLIILTLVLITLWNPSVSAIMVPVGLILTRYAGLHSLNYEVMFGLLAISFVFAFIWHKYS